MASTIVEMFSECLAAEPERVAYIHKSAGSWINTTCAQATARIEAIGAGLVDLKVQPGDRVAILSNSRLEWSLCDYAVLGAAAIVVPIYQTSGASECEYILRDCAASVVFVEDAAQFKKVHEAKANLPELREIVVIDAAKVDAAHLSDEHVRTLAELEAQSSDSGVEAWRKRHAQITPQQDATYIYTSGTTGPPKGCVLSHGNYADMTELIAGSGIDVFSSSDRVILFLPLAHTFARLIGFASTRLHMELAFSTPATLMDDLAEVKPTILPSVPRVFEKAHTRIVGMFAEAHGPKAKLIAWAQRVGALRGRYVQNQRRVPPVLALQYAIASKLVFSKIQARFGGNLRLCISGGAPLSREIQEFFLAAGVLILEGYGLTESTTAVTLNRPNAFRTGSVGPALPRTEIRIADDQEILVRGPQIFQGYHNNDTATAEVKTEDGWLHTGDIGTIDRDGFLFITDRKKDLIVTAGGKNVAPQNVEGALKATQYVSQALVYGDRKPYLTALLTLDPQEMETFAKTHKLPQDMHKLVDTDEVKTMVQEAVAHANAGLGRVEQVKRFRILPIDFTTEGGELTPSLKLKRKVVCERYMSYIEEMYEADAPDCAAITDSKLVATPVPV